MSMTQWRLTTIGVSAVVAAALLTGCTSTTAADRGDREPAQRAQDINSRAPSALRDGGDLRIPVDALPTNYNPVQVNGARVVTWQLAEAIFPGAFSDTADGGHVLNKDFFAAAALTSRKPQVITYKIQEKARWSNGRPITWADLWSQWKALSGKDKRFEGYSNVGYQDIASVARGTSDKEAVVTLTRPFAEWHGLFNLLVPKELSADPEKFNRGWLEGPAITAGPFSVDEIDRTAKTITLERNANWWAARPPLQRVILRVLDPAARADELANDGIDIYPIGADLDLFTRARGIDGVEIRQAPERLAGQLTFNGGRGALLRDEPLRKAIARGIDTKAVTTALMGKIVPGAEPVGNHILPPSDPGYRDNSKALPFDADAARSQLDALGWKQQGNGKVRAKAGRTLSLRFVAQATPVGRTVSGLIKDQLAAIGGDARIRSVPLEKFYDSYLLPGNFDLIAFEWTKSASPFAHDRPVFQKPEGDDFGSNFGRIHIPAIDALYDRGLAELDLAKRQKIANEIDVLAWKHAHHLPLYAGSGAYAVRSGLANYGARGLGAYGFSRAGFEK
ncbi:ABC transporter family substrate-binding protein [Streptomyces sp. NPDC002994]|uniref:ABC transporter family substrate-binding protein n=1 Tax=Streptomyces sp. NPDC002994 TaxID=3154441 RepID=UPI0033B359AE